ncbi:hypothetical protein Y1Q_0018173 [Alligator mississippiensis]|uniref:Uncharacterized protein n=1 Tax=Alligator mississippiensis TaxID=8496 RepID=A0A151MRB9_ALLMI|nr:hypothetical protein Y1Q_0018173 [Alligator mississippiensis]
MTRVRTHNLLQDLRNCSVSSLHQDCPRDLCAAIFSQFSLPAMAPQPVDVYTGAIWVGLLLPMLVYGDCSSNRYQGSPSDHCSRYITCWIDEGKSLDISLNSSSTRFDFSKCNGSTCYLAYSFQKGPPQNFTNDFQGQAHMEKGIFHAPAVSKGDGGSYKFIDMNDNTCLLKIDLKVRGAAAWPSCTILLLLLGLVTSAVL